MEDLLQASLGEAAACCSHHNPARDARSEGMDTNNRKEEAREYTFKNGPFSQNMFKII